jgi:RNA ligase
MQLSKYLDVSELEASIEAGWVRAARHDQLPLTLYTYTEHAQFDGTWNDATRKSRGLVVDDCGRIIAFCMPKFFNYSEHVGSKSYAQPLPLNEDFQIFEKMDGSMGTCFHYAGEWHVATKGSFHSDQAVWATELLRERMQQSSRKPDRLDDFHHHLLEDYTYVCEIIYPGNRIVVDYGDLEDLVLITSYWNKTGEEVLNSFVKNDWRSVGSTVPEFARQGVSLEDLQTLADENVKFGGGYYENDKIVEGTEAEGYVICFESGTRCKIKLGDYLRLHKLLTGCTERTIWESLSQGYGIYEYLENVPDEFRDWAIDISNDLMDSFSSYVLNVEDDFSDILEELGFHKDGLPVAGANRKEFALKAMEYPETRTGLFLLLDQNPAKLDELAWKRCRPAATKPFAAES